MHASHRRRNRLGIRHVGRSSVVYGRGVLSTSMLEVSLLGVGTVLRLERDAWSMVKRLRQATNEYAPPPPLSWDDSTGSLPCKLCCRNCCVRRLTRVHLQDACRAIVCFVCFSVVHVMPTIPLLLPHSIRLTSCCSIHGL